MRSFEKTQKPQIWTVSLSRNAAQMKKTKVWPKSSQFWRLSGYITMPNVRPFLSTRFINHILYLYETEAEAE